MKITRFLSLFILSSLLASCSTNNRATVGSRTEALNDEAWGVSQWISVVDAPVVCDQKHEIDRFWEANSRAADGANWFLSTVKNEQKVVSAKWMTTALGVYELYVNGKLVGDEVLKPGFTHYKKTKRSFTYDITDAFNRAANAENQLSAQVTPGWWADKIITPNKHNGMFGKKCAFRGVLELTFADGSTKLYGTDLENWTAGIAGPVKHAAIFDGEEYDARVPLGFETPELLSTPEINSEFAGEICPSQGAEVYMRHDLTISPVNSYIWQGAEGAKEKEHGKVVIIRNYGDSQNITLNAGETLVVDFGQNAAAVPSFVFTAKEGTVLTCLPAEILNDGNGAESRGMDGPEGSVHRTNLRAYDSCFILKYTFANSEDYVGYYPRCTFFGYRYISVTATDTVIFKSIKSIPVTSMAKSLELGKITTGNESINKLISNTWWGQLSNYLSVPTDCPQRNERLGWTADTQVFAETGSFFANTRTFLHKWMRDMRDSQSETGAYPAVAPFAQYGNSKMRLGWADAGIIVPWIVWKQFADTQIIEDNWESMNRFMNHVNDTKYDHNTLKEENGNRQYADWVSYEPLESHSKSYRIPGTKDILPEAIDYWNFLSASYWAMDADMMADMAVATGRDAAPYHKMAAEAHAYIKSKFVNVDGTFRTPILNTMQTPALFALKVGVVEGEAKEAMIARLRKNFEEHDNCLQTGFLGTSILMSTLTENGMEDIAYELLFQRKNPSWLYSVDNGATTIWERWNSYTFEHGMATKSMNSFNHYAYGCVCEWIWESVAGISSDISTPGFKHIVMKPIPDKRLGFVKAEYNSAAGLIKSAWRYEGDKWIWEFTIPKGSTASVTLPNSQETTLYTAGSYTIIQ
ncbi:MAG: family 78 glycoside hydrolase catalytic domain [Alistipes sp.]|nr:family 78 glycoside hydrolase catalytic domain [Alistipes sp.]